VVLLSWAYSTAFLIFLFSYALIEQRINVFEKSADGTN